MDRPWLAENAVSQTLARSLIETQFPPLAPARLEPYGVGWDNTAWLVNGEWVFRFPRRAIAVSLIESEHALLPALAPRLPLPIPVPAMIGDPEARYPWPFSGYRMIAGCTACRARLDEAQRIAAAPVLGRFLAALHAIPADEARAAGAIPDGLRRLEVGHRAAQITERLGQCAALGLVDDPGAWRFVTEELPAGWTAGACTLVHGDLYARHVLVDDANRPAGVIDWGDVHLGDPAIDLSIAHGFLPPAAHASFRAAYGPVNDDTWRMARFKALLTAVMILVYGHDSGDEDLLFEGRVVLEHLLAGEGRA